MNEQNVINRIYRKAANLNLYCSMCKPQPDRIYRELADIEKDVKQTLDIVSKYIKE